MGLILHVKRECCTESDFQSTRKCPSPIRPSVITFSCICYSHMSSLQQHGCSWHISLYFSSATQSFHAPFTLCSIHFFKHNLYLIPEALKQYEILKMIKFLFPKGPLQIVACSLMTTNISNYWPKSVVLKLPINRILFKIIEFSQRTFLYLTTSTNFYHNRK